MAKSLLTREPQTEFLEKKWTLCMQHNKENGYTPFHLGNLLVEIYYNN